MVEKSGQLTVGRSILGQAPGIVNTLIGDTPVEFLSAQKYVGDGTNKKNLRVILSIGKLLANYNK